MSRRKTVKINLEFVNPQIKKVCRSNVIFCEKMGRPKQKTWVSDWNRFDKNGKWIPKNLPSPEEAAQMCVLLDATPEEILLSEGETPEETEKLQRDIETVRRLVAEQEKKVGTKKERSADGEALVSSLPEDIQQLIQICTENPSLAAALLAVAQQIEKGQAARG